MARPCDAVSRPHLQGCHLVNMGHVISRAQCFNTRLAQSSQALWPRDSVADSLLSLSPLKRGAIHLSSVTDTSTGWPQGPHTEPGESRAARPGSLPRRLDDSPRQGSGIHRRTVLVLPLPPLPETRHLTLRQTAPDCTGVSSTERLLEDAQEARLGCTVRGGCLPRHRRAPYLAFLPFEPSDEGSVRRQCLRQGMCTQMPTRRAHNDPSSALHGVFPFWVLKDVHSGLQDQ